MRKLASFVVKGPLFFLKINHCQNQPVTLCQNCVSKPAPLPKTGSYIPII